MKNNLGKMKIIKKIKKRMAGLSLPVGLKGQLDSSNSMSNQGPLGFHRSSHGENVKISKDGSVAKRVESFCKGITFSNRPVRVNEYVLLKLAEVSTNWSGVIRFGFTNQDPKLHQTKLPKYACPDLTNREGFWAKALPDRMVREDIILFYYVTKEGNVHYGINDEEKGVFFIGVDTKKPLWALIDIYGNTVAVEIIDPLKQLKQEAKQHFECKSTSCDINSVSKYYPQCPLKPLRFHPVTGKHVHLSNDRLTAARDQSEYSQGYVFSERPLKSSEQLVIKVLENVTDYFGALSFGLTSCDPSKLNPFELPENCDQLLDRKEYWVVMKDVAMIPKPGDELCFQLTSEGEILFSKNNGPVVSLLHVDQSQKLWAFFDIYGITLKIKSLGSYSEVSKLTNTKKTTKSPRSTPELADPECMICCERPINSVLYSCGHMCMCYECAEAHLKKPGGNWCPICRAKVHDVIRTYRS
ncbi:E3 ubiquitin-protein ligase neurl1b [Chamberlinius hualienensis]